MKRKNGRHGIDMFNQQLLDRIDNMPDPESFSPYSPTKKTIIQDSELFDSEIYRSEDSEDQGFNEYETSQMDKKTKAMNSSIFILILLILALTIGVIVYFMCF